MSGDITFDSIRSELVNTILDNWKKSVDNLNYKIPYITPADYGEYMHAINRVYTTELAHIAQGLKMTNCEEPAEHKTRNPSDNMKELSSAAVSLFDGLMSKAFGNSTSSNTQSNTESDMDINDQYEEID